MHIYYKIKNNIVGNWVNKKSKLAISFNEDKTCRITTKIYDDSVRLNIVDGIFKTSANSEIIINYKNPKDSKSTIYDHNNKIILNVNDVNSNRLDLIISDHNFKNTNVVLYRTEIFLGEYCIHKWYDNYLNKNFSTSLINSFNFYFYGGLVLLFISTIFFTFFGAIAFLKSFFE